MSALHKLNAERNQRTLLELASKPGNDVCADCKSRNPRWASHNLGIFICVNCASVHRKLGTHITKVKSLSLDEWTKEQVEHMKQNGNVKSNAYYNPNEALHPPPTTMMDNERDSELEQHIRSKYEYKRFMNKPSMLGPPSRSMQNASVQPPSRAVSNPVSIPTSTPSSSAQTGLGINRPLTSSIPASSAAPMSRQPPMRSASQPLSTAMSPQSQQTPQFMKPMPPLPNQAPVQVPSSNPVWDDLISLSQPSMSASLPLQVSTQPVMNNFSQPTQYSMSSPLLGGSVSSPFQPQSMAYPAAAQPTGMPNSFQANGLLTPSQQFLQPQATSPIIPQPMAGYPSNYPQNSSPMSHSPQPMFSTPSPMLQTPFTNNMTTGMGMQPPMQPPMPYATQQSPFMGYQQQQQQPTYATSVPQQQQFTGWMQAPMPSQQPGGQQWGGF
ncbi:hypothetical protein ONZ45_g5627 [Pleurotus djamor]|nr:hypothetical protein ONZ45_g5627 [Pleurotus djamor]